MKKSVPLFLFTLLMTSFLAFLTASAQGEWKWANYWTGNDDPLNSTNPYNYIVRTAFDDDGNVYVFGSFGGNATLYDQIGDSHFSNNAMVVSANTQGIVLIKFDSLGNYLWSRIVKTLRNETCRPYDMVLRDNHILISGEYGFYNTMNEKLVFLDTLITEQAANSYQNNEHFPPYTFGNYSFFSYLDLDGNVIENHFVKVLTRELYHGEHGQLPIADGNIGMRPVCIDGYGNTYVAVNRFYGGTDTLPFTVVIDEDSSKTYPLFLPGNCGNTFYINNMMLYKFTPNWELDWMKIVVVHTEGLSPALPIDSVNTSYSQYIGGMSIDNDNNLYLSGYLSDMWMYDTYNQYPLRFFFDSTHYVSAFDHSLAFCLPFIVKYDSGGQVEWANQVYAINDSSTTWYNKIEWTNNLIQGNSVYLLGRTDVSDIAPNATVFYYDETSNNMPINQSCTFFVRYNKQDGSYENFGIIPGEKSDLARGKTTTPAVINNHFICMVNDYYRNYRLLCQFDIFGNFWKADTVYHSYDIISGESSTIINDRGNILCSFACGQDPIFGHDLTLNFDDHQHSHAVIAYRSDPSILEPYPEDSTAVPQYDERLSEIRLYPNPATDRVVIESPEGLPVSMVAVTNESGQLLFLQPATSCRTELSVRNLPAGLYVAHVSTSVGSTAIKFVVRN